MVERMYPPGAYRSTLVGPPSTCSTSQSSYKGVSFCIIAATDMILSLS